MFSLRILKVFWAFGMGENDGNPKKIPMINLDILSIFLKSFYLRIFTSVLAIWVKMIPSSHYKSDRSAHFLKIF